MAVQYRFLFLAVLVLTAQCQDLSDLWSAWKINMNKAYPTVEEEAHRYQAFVDNYNFIQEYNAQNTGTILGLTIFADMTNEEFAASHKCLTANAMDDLKDKTPMTVFDMAGVPSSWDWRQNGAVTSIKNQQQCGGCWSFAAAGGLEGLNAIQGNTLVSFSEQQLIDCCTTCNGCNGCDNLYNALAYTASEGIEDFTTYPFEGESGSCEYSSGEVSFTNNGYQQVTPQNADQLMAAIYTNPTLVGIEADQQIFQLYSGGVIQSGCGDAVDHAVLAVGYGPYNGISAFIVKNSWGTSWGVQGFVYIATDQTQNGGNGVCGILSSPVYPN